MTLGNTDDRKPLPELIKYLSGCLYANKGYLSDSLKQQLKTIGISLITNIEKKMKPVKHTCFDKTILRHPSVIETVFDELKNLCQIEYTRHRSPANFIVNLLAELVAYCLMASKPKIPVVGTYLQA